MSPRHRTEGRWSLLRRGFPPSPLGLTTHVKEKKTKPDHIIGIVFYLKIDYQTYVQTFIKFSNFLKILNNFSTLCTH